MTRKERNRIVCALKAVSILARWQEEQTPEPRARTAALHRLEALLFAETCLREALHIPDEMTRDDLLQIDRGTLAFAYGVVSASPSAMSEAI